MRSIGADETNKDEHKKFAEACKSYLFGTGKTADFFPNKLFGHYPDENVVITGQLINASGFVVVKQEMKDVFEEFELGKTCFYPVQLFQNDRKTEIQGTFSIINFDEEKKAFSPEASPKTKVAWPGHEFDVRSFGTYAEHDIVSVLPAALEGVDVWHDPLFFNSIFF